MSAVADEVLEAVRRVCVDLDAKTIEELRRALYTVGVEKSRAEIAAFRESLRPGMSATIDTAFFAGRTYIKTGTEVTILRRHPSKTMHLVRISVTGYSGQQWVQTSLLLPVNSEQAERRREVAPAEEMLHRLFGAIR